MDKTSKRGRLRHLVGFCCVTLTACGAPLAPAAQADEPIDRSPEQSPTAQVELNRQRGNNKNRVARFLTSPGFQLYTAVGVSLPLLSDGKAGEQQSLRTVDALLVGAIAETALKRITKEKRPDAVPGKDTKDYSFPSGHATASFVVATMQGHYHPKQALYWYTGAALISASRVKLRRHYVRDVVAGAALGYAIGRLEVSRPRGLILSPFISSNQVSRNKRSGRSLQFSTRF